MITDCDHVKIVSCFFYFIYGVSEMQEQMLLP